MVDAVVQVARLTAGQADRSTPPELRVVHVEQPVDDVHGDSASFTGSGETLVQWASPLIDAVQRPSGAPLGDGCGDGGGRWDAAGHRAFGCRCGGCWPD